MEEILKIIGGVFCIGLGAMIIPTKVYRAIAGGIFLLYGLHLLDAIP